MLLKPLAYIIENEKDTTLNTLYSHLDLEQETKKVWMLSFHEYATSFKNAINNIRLNQKGRK